MYRLNDFTELLYIFSGDTFNFLVNKPIEVESQIRES